jgi:hypothetical protein
MFDYQTIKLMHRHGEGDYAPMAEGSEHSPAASDPERAWLRGARIFRCMRCEDEIIMVDSVDAPGEPPHPIA